MLKRSLLTIAVLGVFVATSGAHSEGEAEKAKDLQGPELGFLVEAPPATCGAFTAEAQSVELVESLLEEQSSSQVEEMGVEIALRGRCFMCFPWGCITVRC